MMPTRAALDRSARSHRKPPAPLQGLVLELLAQSATPVSAYALIHDLQQRFGRPVAPTSVYRALAALTQRREVARINALNAFVRCAHAGQLDHRCVFFVCRCCKHAIEIEDHRLALLLDDDADRLGFAISRPVVEIEGMCRACRPPTPPRP